MKKKRLSNQQLLKKQKLDEKKFNKTMLISFSLVFLLVILILLLIYWCDARYIYRKYALYGKEIPKTLVCMMHDGMRHHESSEVELNAKVFYVCSHNCHQHLIEYYQEHAFTTDAYSGDSICKAGAVIGLKKKGEPVVAYFKNKQTMNKYYEQKNK